LKSTLAGAAASAVQLTLPSGVHAGGSDMLKIGLVGCGGRGTGAAEDALRADKNTKLTALCDVFPDHLQKALPRLQKLFGDRVDVPPERQFTDFSGYQQLIDSGVDVVLLATPPQFRPQHAEAVVKAGKHCFFEKPVAVDAAGVRRFIQIAHEAEKKKICFMSGFCYRHDLAKRETIGRIHDGAIGDVLAMQVNYVTGPIWHRGGDVKNQDMEYQMRNWYYFCWLSGDFIVEQHVHNMDKASWVMKGQMPAHATALGGRQVRTDPKYGNIYDHFSVVFEYPSGAKVFSYCRQMPKCKYNEVSDHVIGSKGSAQLMEHVIRGAENWAYEGKAPSMYQQEHDELFAAIRAGQVINDGVSAANSTMMSIMGRMAAYSGERLSWSDAMASSQDLTPRSGYRWGPLEVAPVPMPGVTKVL
jgi:predicted dehydrogenase